MVIVALTAQEIARHEQAVGKIRGKLLACHTSEEFGIVHGSEHVLSAVAEERWNADCGSYRRITWGGLRLVIAGNKAHFKLTITHFERDVFIVHIANEKGNTEVVAPTKFVALDEFVWQHVEQCRGVSPTKRSARLASDNRQS